MELGDQKLLRWNRISLVHKSCFATIFCSIFITPMFVCLFPLIKLLNYHRKTCLNHEVIFIGREEISSWSCPLGDWKTRWGVNSMVCYMELSISEFVTPEIQNCPRVIALLVNADHIENRFYRQLWGERFESIFKHKIIFSYWNLSIVALGARRVRQWCQVIKNGCTNVHWNSGVANPVKTREILE